VTREEIRAAHTEEEHTMPPAEDPRQAYLYAVIQRMMKRRPEDRYPSAGALVRALEPIAEPSLPILAAGADRWHIGEIEVMLRVGDIADASACVIVNAANTDLAMRVGVAAALRRAGGEAIAAEAEARAPAKMGDVIWTGAGALKARWVAHAVAALAGAICVARCTLRVLIGAEAREAGSVAIPALGTGVGGVPMALGAKLMLEAMRTFAALGPARVQRVEVVLFDEPAAEAWRMVLRAMCG
jgi:O-acetyl-ADP-ribose deacetylase (regulator of RNase III)